MSLNDVMKNMLSDKADINTKEAIMNKALEDKTKENKDK